MPADPPLIDHCLARRQRLRPRERPASNDRASERRGGCGRHPRCSGRYARTQGYVTWLSRNALLVHIAAFASWGWLSYQAAKTPPDRLKNPQTVQVYVSNPHASAELTAVIAQPTGRRPSVEYLDLSIATPAGKSGVSWLVVSELHPILCTAGPTIRTLVRLGINPSAKPVPAWTCQGSSGSPSSQVSESPSFGRLAAVDPQAAALTEGLTTVATTTIAPVWRAPAGAGVLFAHLPALADQPLSQPYVSLIIDRMTPLGPGKPTDVLDETPQLRAPAAGAQAPQSYQTLPHATGPTGLAYFGPATVSTQAILQLRGQSQLINYRVDQIDPTDGTFQDGNFLWSGSGYIEPTAYMTNPVSDNSRANDEFISGVALAVAATAFVALMQEIRRDGGGANPRGPATAREQAATETGKGTESDAAAAKA